MNGEVIVQFQGTTWSTLPSGNLDICWDIVAIKGPPIFPPSVCFTDFQALGLPVSGTPLLIDTDSDGNIDFIIRATLAH
jgi:hypothetical protein